MRAICCIAYTKTKGSIMTIVSKDGREKMHGKNIDFTIRQKSIGSNCIPSERATPHSFEWVVFFSLSGT